MDIAILPPLLTVVEVARRLSISRTAAYMLLDERRPGGAALPSVRIGTSLRVRPADLEAFIAAGGRRPVTMSG